MTAHIDGICLEESRKSYGSLQFRPTTIIRLFAAIGLVENPYTVSVEADYSREELQVVSQLIELQKLGFTQFSETAKPKSRGKRDRWIGLRHARLLAFCAAADGSHKTSSSNYLSP